jgi:hypothetical protein
MTHLLKQAFAKAAKLPDFEQNAFAHWIMDELASEKRWDKAFAESEVILGQLAEEALQEHSRKKTKPLNLL